MAHRGCDDGAVPGDALLRDGLELAVVVALGGMLWAAVRRVRAGAVVVPRCHSCGRPTSRAYPACTRCGAPRRPRGDSASDHS